MSITPSRFAANPVITLALATGLTAQGFLPPPTPAGNPTTANKANLGKALFWDEQLSSSRTIACGTCHVFAAGGADPRTARAIAPGADAVFGTADDVHGSPGVPLAAAGGAYVAGAFGLDPQVTPRLAPSVVNAAYLAELFWDGRARSPVFRDPITNAVVLADHAALENLVAQPPLNAIEMGHLGRSWSDVAARIAAVQPLALADAIPPALAAYVGSNGYPQLFQQAFGSAGVTPARIVMAIAAYLRTLISDQSPVDRFVLAGAPALAPTVQRGLGVFLRNCTACHQNVVSFTASPDIVDFRNTGVRPIAEDLGRFAVTGVAADRGVFKVPDLRNVALRPRFFHNGGAATLTEVVDFYNRGGDFHVGQDPLLLPLANSMTALDRADLVAMLQALTDPRVQGELPPFDRPRLYSESSRRPSGYGAASGAPAPRAVAVEPPLVGNPEFTLGLSGAAPNALAVLFVDGAANVAGAPFLGIQVHLAGTAALAVAAGPQPTVASGGTAFTSATFALPNDPLLRGQTAFCQWLVLDAVGGLQASTALRVPFF